eukprot:gnl/MRDRNA2_/MRDRNA2_84553_c0_seq1.p1 gnl/MRDRNA2_/MRDRNA2_84553_c0~~gnl/MRDRNA2_/MRDRNA2_84553_c0_seq1.p1  ORF type:complete len:282 (-),score=21.71 gnl/MRDRNA2_/MRDRNA2_84553_c0_seq1:59-904(-)
MIMKLQTILAFFLSFYCSSALKLNLMREEPWDETVGLMDPYLNLDGGKNEIMPSSQPWLSIDEEFLHDFRTGSRDRNKKKFHWMRAGKSGSTAVRNFLKNGGCGSVVIHFHDFGSNMLQPSAKSFMVLRNPIERFVSAWAHMKARSGSLKFIIDENYNTQSLFESPLTLARALNESPRVHDFFIKPHAQPGYKQWQHVLVIWPYSYYANKNTLFACLPNLWTDIATILHKNVPGCKVTDYEMRYNAHGSEYDHSWVNNHQLRGLVSKFFSKDVALWNAKCS